MPNWDISLFELVAATCIAAAGALVQASVGFGFALVVVPLLTLLDPTFVPGPTLLANLLLALLMGIRGRGAIDRGQLGLAVGGLVVGTIIGAVILSMVPREHLTALFGLVILVAVILSIVGHHIPITTRSLVTVGVSSGVMGTTAGIHGPAIALLYQRESGVTVRGMLAVFYAVGYTISIFALYMAGLFGLRELYLGTVLAPGVVAGYLSARTLMPWLDGKRLHRAILAVAGVSGLILLGKPLLTLVC